MLYLTAFLIALGSPAAEPQAAQAKPAIKILFLGDNAGHRPIERFRILQPVLAARGIDLTYTDKVDVLNPKSLAAYDGLLIYANTTRISPEQEKALLEYVESGKGFIPLHCASYCFLNSPKYIELVGAQFQRHDTGTFNTILAEPNHPIMKGFGGFSSWDETYVHTKHNPKDRTVLEYRAERGGKEPWTWVRTQGKGRVFYTAWGHDQRTWGHLGFHNLVERGIRWAVGGDPSVAGPYAEQTQMTKKRTDVKPFEYVEAKVPFYPPNRRGGATAEPLKKMQKPLDADESMKHMVMPVGLEAKLFVSEPQLGGKPITMNWDERGRLWVAVTLDYPNELQPQGKGRDKILICEDTKGTGQADKITVFADKLSIPTSLIFARGGVIVHQAPHTLFLKDNDGDGVADERKVLFTGWHTGDTHAGPSNLRYGPDNWIYGIVGYSGFDGTIGGEKFAFRQGFYRFKPDGSKFEFLRSTSNNSWGVGFSEEGILFGSTANGNPSMHLPVPNRYYESVRGLSSGVLRGIAGNEEMHPITENVRQVDYHGRFTAAAGHALYTARAYPRQYWNRTAFVTEPTGHLVATFEILPEGGTYRSRNAFNLLASDDEWTSPTMAELGPDGNVWVIDWYSYIVQHNPTPPGFRTGRGAAYETELRDKTHGRIYRLVHSSPVKKDDIKSLDPADPKSMVKALKSTNMFWRNHAQRLLVERGKKDVLPDLLTLVSDPSVDEIGLNGAVMHALWTIQGLGVLDGSDNKAAAAAMGALKHASAGVRRNAVAVLPKTEESITAIVSAGLLKDQSPQVRLAAYLALAEMPLSKVAAEGLVAALEQGSDAEDRPLRDAITAAAAKHDTAFLAAAGRRGSKSATVSVVERVAEHYARGRPENVGGLLIELVAAKDSMAGAIVGGLSRGWPREKLPKLDEQADKALAELLPKLPATARGQLLELAIRWNSKALASHAAEISKGLLTQLRDEKASLASRLAAASQIIDIRLSDPTAAKELLDLVTPRVSAELGQGLLDALSKTEAPNIGNVLTERLPTFTPALRRAGVRVLLSRADWTDSLLQSLEKGALPLTELSLDQQQTLATHPRQAIASRAKELLAKGGGLPSADRQKVIEELVSASQLKGDVEAGKVVFKNQCAKCHTHSGEGAKIGPDLTGMAVHPKPHLLVEILDPSRSVEGNYRQYIVATKSGRVLSGLLTAESRNTIELLDAEGKQHVVQRDEVEELQASNKSLMPEGFEKQLSKADLTNVLEFLTARGKYLPLPIDKVATVVSTKGMFNATDSTAERMIFDSWTMKTVKGVPFHLVDPLGDRIPNAILLHGPQGGIPPKMPRSVRIPCNVPAKAIHFLSGVSGWGFPYGEKGSVSMIVRLHYDDGQIEDHPLKNGLHFADYIRRVEVPESQFAFNLRGKQIRYLSIQPKRPNKISTVELVKGPDSSAPVVMAVTVEGD